MYKQGTNYMDYFNPKSTGEPKNKRIWKQIWKWTKIFGFLFIIVSMLWGCIQMYQPAYMVQQVTDMAGNKVFAPGTTFEIIINSLGEEGGKSHFITGSIGSGIHEYSYNTITSWGDAFRVTKSPFYGFFVYPMAFILVGFVDAFAGTLNPGLDASEQAKYGVSVLFAILLTVLIVRSITLLFSWKAQKNQEKMQEMQLKQAEIQAKYKNSGAKMDAATRQRQQAELQALYKKEGISPMSSMAMSFASLPFLFAIYGIVRSTRALKIANIGEISLIEQPWHMLTHGHPVYLSLLAVYLPLQIISMLLPTFLQWRKQKGSILTAAQKKARKRNLIIQIVMVVVFIFVVATVASGVAIYWIFSSTFQIGQTLGFHFYNKKRAKSGNREKERRLRQMKKSSN